MNKFTKLLLSRTLLFAPSYRTTDFVIDASLDYTGGGTLNVNVDATLETNNAINFGEGAFGTIASGKTLANNGFIYYHEILGTDPNYVTGVFRSGVGVINQDYDTETSQVKGKITLNEITYSVKQGTLLGGFEDKYQKVLKDIMEEQCPRILQHYLLQFSIRKMTQRILLEHNLLKVYFLIE